MANPGEMPQVGVQLVVKDYQQYIGDLEAAVAATERAAAKIGRVYTVQFKTEAPTQQELNAIILQIEQTAKNASQKANIQFTATMGGAKTTGGGTGTGTGGAKVNADLKAREQLLRNLDKLEGQTSRIEMSRLGQRERLEREMNNALAERLQLRQDLAAAGASDDDVRRAENDLINMERLYRQQINDLDQAAAQQTQQATAQRQQTQEQRLASMSAAVQGFDNEVRAMGIRGGETFYVFQDIEAQAADFSQRMTKTWQDYGKDFTDEQANTLVRAADDYGRLYLKRVEQAQKDAGDRLRRESFESSFLGELARAETRTYGARILASEAQRAGMLLLGGGTVIAAGAKKLTEQYLMEFRQPLSRVSRALDLSGEERTFLEDSLLQRAGRQSLQSADDQAAAMRRWAEAINVTVDSSSDLLDVQNGIEVGLIPQTEMISNLVKLNEGTATLDQTVADSAAILVQYGLSAQDAAEQTKNLELVVALLDTAASSGLADVNDIGSSLKYFAGRARDLNVSLPESVALVESLAQVGLKGSQAGRGLDQLLKAFVAPTPKAVGAFENILGEDWQSVLFDEEGNFKGMSDAIFAIANATAEWTDQTRQHEFAALGDANAVRTLNALLILEAEAAQYGVDAIATLTQLREKGSAGIEREVAILERLTGIDYGDGSAIESYRKRLADMRDEMETLYSNALIQLNSALLEIGRSAADTVVPALESVADVLSLIADLIDKHPWLAKAVLTGAGTAILAGGALSVVGTAARYTVDAVSLWQAYQGVGKIGGIRRTGGFWGYGNNVATTLVTAMQSGQYTDDELTAIVNAAGGRKITDPADIERLLAGAGAGAGAGAVGRGAIKSILAPSAAFIGAMIYEELRSSFVKGEAQRLAASETPSDRAIANLLNEQWIGSLITSVYGAIKEDGAGGLDDAIQQLVGFLGKWGTPVGGTANLFMAIESKLYDDVVKGSAFEGRFNQGFREAFSPGGAFGGEAPTSTGVPISDFFAQLPSLIGDIVRGSPLGDFVNPPSDGRQDDYGLRHPGQDIISASPAFAKAMRDMNLDAAIADFYELDAEGKKLGSTIDGIISASSDMAAEMQLAGVPAEEIDRFIGMAHDSMVQLSDDAASGSMNLWQMAAASAEINKELSEAAQEALAIQRLRSGEITNEYKESGFLDPAGIEASMEDYAKQIDDMASDLRELGMPDEEVRNLKNTALDQLKAFAQQFVGPSPAEQGAPLGPTMDRIKNAPAELVRRVGTGILQPFVDAIAAAEAAAEEAEGTLGASEAIASGETLRLAIGTNVVKVQDLLDIESGVFSDVTSLVDELAGSSFDTGSSLENMRIQITAAVHNVIVRITEMIAAGLTVTGNDVARMLDAELAPTRALVSAASLENAAMTGDQRARKAINDDLKAVQESTASDEVKAQAARNAATALNILESSAKSSAKSFEDSARSFVSKLRGMISSAIAPSAGLTVTPEQMAQTRLGTYTDGAWEPLRRLASAATDPNTEWKDMLPPGVGVNSDAAKAYFETVKAGVERFDPAYSAFFPDKGKIVEGVIGDLEGEQRQEQFVTSIIEEMAAMGYDKKTLEKYFADPEKELEESMSLLGFDVDGLSTSVSDNTSATKGQTEAIGFNTEEMKLLRDELANWGGKGNEDDDDGEDDETPPPDPNPNPNPRGGPTEFARGGLVTKPTFALIGEAGPELVIPLSRMGAGRGFVMPAPQVQLSTIAPQIGQMNINTNVSSPSPAFVAHAVNNMQRRSAVNLGREILRAATKEGY